MATSCSSLAAGRCEEAPRPPQPIWAKRIFSPALAALRMLNGAAETRPAARADFFTNERRDNRVSGRVCSIDFNDSLDVYRGLALQSIITFWEVGFARFRLAQQRLKWG